ncbi:hypothetical protein H6P81_015972 [Aristolochia fimbriata]|uniref:Uncharacterized protein n=1 Tax=Aristolochia fimbriata TaxID=158543 RepID=A0AAV7EA62_ARIFI|nr:hypothetical protein H6P81_015972 [Aristolochia fimbriata]
MAPDLEHGNLTRLSATDILALAIDEERSVNAILGVNCRIPRTIEVFERKLHPRPLGQGYTCSGATPDACSPPPVPCCPTAGRCGGRRGAADWSPLPPGRVVAPPLPGPCAGLKSRSEALALKRTPAGSAASRTGGLARDAPQVRWEHPLSLSISISGGEETYKDSPIRSKRPRDGPGASPMEWGAREGDSPVVPGPAATARCCRRSRVVWECSPNRAGSGWGRRCASVRARDGERRSAADSGCRPTLVTGDQARADDPARGYAASRGPRRVAPRLTGRVPSRAPAAPWRRPAGSPFDPP